MYYILEIISLPIVIALVGALIGALVGGMVTFLFTLYQDDLNRRDNFYIKFNNFFIAYENDISDLRNIVLKNKEINADYEHIFAQYISVYNKIYENKIDIISNAEIIYYNCYEIDQINKISNKIDKLNKIIDIELVKLINDYLKSDKHDSDKKNLIYKIIPIEIELGRKFIDIENNVNTFREHFKNYKFNYPKIFDFLKYIWRQICLLVPIKIFFPVKPKTFKNK